MAVLGLKSCRVARWSLEASDLFQLPTDDHPTGIWEYDVLSPLSFSSDQSYILFTVWRAWYCTNRSPLLSRRDAAMTGLQLIFPVCFAMPRTGVPWHMCYSGWAAPPVEHCSWSASQVASTWTGHYIAWKCQFIVRNRFIPFYGVAGFVAGANPSCVRQGIPRTSRQSSSQDSLTDGSTAMQGANCTSGSLADLVYLLSYSRPYCMEMINVIHVTYREMRRLGSWRRWRKHFFFYTGETIQLLHKPMAQHRRTNPSGQDSAVHLHLTWPGWLWPSSLLIYIYLTRKSLEIPGKDNTPLQSYKNYEIEHITVCQKLLFLGHHFIFSILVGKKVKKKQQKTGHQSKLRTLRKHTV